MLVNQWKIEYGEEIQPLSTRWEETEGENPICYALICYKYLVPGS